MDLADDPLTQLDDQRARLLTSNDHKLVSMNLRPVLRRSKPPDPANPLEEGRRDLDFHPVGGFVERHCLTFVCVGIPSKCFLRKKPRGRQAHKERESIAMEVSEPAYLSMIPALSGKLRMRAYRRLALQRRTIDPLPSVRVAVLDQRLDVQAKGSVVPIQHVSEFVMPARPPRVAQRRRAPALAVSNARLPIVQDPRRRNAQSPPFLSLRIVVQSPDRDRGSEGPNRPQHAEDVALDSTVEGRNHHGPILQRRPAFRRLDPTEKLLRFLAVRNLHPELRDVHFPVKGTRRQDDVSRVPPLARTLEREQLPRFLVPRIEDRSPAAEHAQLLAFVLPSLPRGSDQEVSVLVGYRENLRQHRRGNVPRPLGTRDERVQDRVTEPRPLTHFNPRSVSLYTIGSFFKKDPEC